MNNSNTAKKKANATVITGSRTRLSFPHLFEPQGFEDSKPMYSVRLLIPKDDRKTLDKIQAAIKGAYANGANKLRGNDADPPSIQEIHLPLNDGDRKHPEDPACKNHYYLNAKNSQPPVLFGIDGETVTNRNELYSGCYAKCKIEFFAYNKKGNKGITASLLGLRKTADGEPLGGSICTAADFEGDGEFADEDDFLS